MRRQPHQPAEEVIPFSTEVTESTGFLCLQGLCREASFRKPAHFTPVCDRVWQKYSTRTDPLYHQRLFKPVANEKSPRGRQQCTRDPFDKLRAGSRPAGENAGLRDDAQGFGIGKRTTE